MKRFYQTLDPNVANSCWLFDLDEETFTLSTFYGGLSLKSDRLKYGTRSIRTFDSLAEAQKYLKKKEKGLLRKGFQLSDWDLPLKLLNFLEKAAREEVKELDVKLYGSGGTEQISKLTHLECLSLQPVQNGMGSLRLPEFLFAQLTNLKKLDCYRVANIPASISACQQLETLKIRYVTEALPKTLGKLSALTELEVEHNLLNLPENIGQLKKLKELTLGHNDETTELPDGLCDLDHLEKLKIHYYHKLSSLPARFGNLKRLKVFKLLHTLLNVDFLELPSSLYLLESLEELHIHSARLLSLPSNWEDLPNLKKLEKLILNCEKLPSLPSNFGALTSLKTLEIGISKLRELPASFGQLQNLKRLIISSKNLNEFPEVLTRLQKLEHLRFYGGRIETIPDSIKNMSSLKELTLHSKPKAGFSDGFFELQNLEKLHLSYAKLEDIPPKIAQLQKLNKLTIGRSKEVVNLSRYIKGKGKAALFVLFKEGVEIPETKLSKAEIKKILDEKKRIIDKLRNNLWIHPENEAFIDFITFKTNVIPTVDARGTNDSTRMALLSPLEEWTDFEHRVMTCMTHDIWVFLPQDGQYPYYDDGLYEPFCRWYRNTTEKVDFQLLVNTLGRYKISRDEVLALVIQKWPRWFITVDNKITTIGSVLLRELEKEPEKILNWVKKSRNRFSFIRLLCWQAPPALRDKHLSSLLLYGVGRNESFSNLYIIKEIVEKAYPACLPIILPKLLEKETTPLSRAQYCILSKRYLRDELELNKELVTKAFKYLDHKRIDFREPEASPLESIFRAYGMEVRDLAWDYMESNKYASIADYQVFAEYLGQESVEIVIEGLKPRKGRKFEYDHYCKMFRLLTPFDYSAHYDMVWEVLTTDSVGVQELVAKDLIKRQVPDIEKRAFDLLNHRKASYRIGGVLLLYHLGYSSDIQALKEQMDKEKSEKVRSLMVKYFNTSNEIIDKQEALRRIAATKARGKLKRQVTAWLNVEKLPPLYWVDGEKLEVEAVRFLFHKQRNQDSFSLDPEAAPIYRFIDKQKSGDFARALQVLLEENGDYYLPYKFIFIPMLHLGDERLLPSLVHFCDYTHYHNMPALIGMVKKLESAKALNEIMDKYITTYSYLGVHAGHAYENIRKHLGYSKIQLADLIIPAYSFDDLYHDFQARGKAYQVYFLGVEHIEYTNQKTGKISKRMPSYVDVADKKHIRKMEKEIRINLRKLKDIFKEAMKSQERWSTEEWPVYFLKKAIPLTLAKSLVWGIYDEQDKLLNSFGLAQDHSLIDINGQPFSLDKNLFVGIVQTQEMKSISWSKWEEYFAGATIRRYFK